MPTYVTGKKTVQLQGFTGGVDVPKLDPGLSTYGVKSAWSRFAKTWYENMENPLSWAEDVVAFAEGMPSVDAYRDAYEEAQWERVAGVQIRLDHFTRHRRAREALGIEESPNAGHSGRHRNYLDSLFEANCGDEYWADMFSADAQRTARETRLEDQAGDYNSDLTSDMEEGIDDILDQLDDTHADDDVMIEALESATTQAEREYILGRLLDENSEGSSAYFELGRRLDGDEKEEFEAFRKKAGHFGQAGLDGVQTTTVGDSFGQAARALPGAIQGTGYGMVTSVPILGDMVEAEYGKDARAYLDRVNETMGVDEDYRRMVTEIAITGGNISGTIGQMAVTGGASAQFKAGRMTAKGVAGLALQGADIVKGGALAIGGTGFDGKDLSWQERLVHGASATIGLSGGLKMADEGIEAATNGATAQQKAAAAFSGDKRLARQVAAAGDDASHGMTPLLSKEVKAQQLLTDVEGTNKALQGGGLVQGAKDAATNVKGNGLGITQGLTFGAGTAYGKSTRAQTPEQQVAAMTWEELQAEVDKMAARGETFRQANALYAAKASGGEQATRQAMVAYLGGSSLDSSVGPATGALKTLATSAASR